MFYVLDVNWSGCALKLLKQNLPAGFSERPLTTGGPSGLYSECTRFASRPGHRLFRLNYSSLLVKFMKSALKWGNDSFVIKLAEFLNHYHLDQGWPTSTHSKATQCERTRRTTAFIPYIYRMTGGGIVLTRTPLVTDMTFVSLLFINFLKPTGYVMHQQFNIQQLYVLPTLYLSENKQQLVPLTP